MAKKRQSNLFKRPWSLVTLLLGLGAGYSAHEYFPRQGHIEVLNDQQAIFDIRFSPRGGCLELILQTLALAQDHVYVHTYSFTSQEIAQALINAHRRGVRVLVIADKRESQSHYARLQALVDAGIEVRIDKVSGLAHNKIMVVDDNWVITGSYNWSAAAEKRNAENIVRITNPAVNKHYATNFWTRYQKGNSL